MTLQWTKTGFLAAALVVLLAGCSSKGQVDRSGADIESIGDSGVATGTLYGDGLTGAAAELARVADTVFYFEFDRAVLRPEARAALRLHADYLKRKPLQVRLEGHADERGSREYNMALGERRAQAVKEFLVMQGVDGSILEVISYGEESPAVLGSSESVWAQNRRVEMR